MKVRPFYACKKDKRLYVEVDALDDVPKLIKQPVIQGKSRTFSECEGCRYVELKDVISREKKGVFPVLGKIGYCYLYFEGVRE